jgi:hypothetical protein
VHVEAVREQQRGAALERLADVRIEHLLRDIRNQHGHHIRAADRGERLGDAQPVAPRLLPAGAALAHADDHVEAGVLEIERMRPTLAAIAEDGDTRALEGLTVDVFVRIQPHRHTPQRPNVAHKKPRSGRAGAGFFWCLFARAWVLIRRSRVPRTALR